MPPSLRLTSPRRRAGTAVVTVRSLARDRCVTVHRVLVAAALGELRVRRREGRVFIDAASAAAWRPTASDSAPAAA